MIRPALLWLVLVASAGCADRPRQTSPAAPVDYGDPGSTSDGEPLPTLQEPRRIEMH